MSDMTEEMSGTKEKNKIFSLVLTFCTMFIFWLLLSAWTLYLPDPYDFSKVARGVLAALVVTCLTYEMFVQKRSEKVLFNLRRLLPYIIWEVYQIVLATIDVAYRVVGTLPIDPRIIEFDTTLRSDMSLFTLATSITLTPGTVTIDIEPERGRYTVHAIETGPAESLTVDQGMQKYVGWVFSEE